MYGCILLCAFPPPTAIALESEEPDDVPGSVVHCPVEPPVIFVSVRYGMGCLWLGICSSVNVTVLLHLRCSPPREIFWRRKLSKYGYIYRGWSAWASVIVSYIVYEIIDRLIVYANYFLTCSSYLARYQSDIICVCHLLRKVYPICSSSCLRN